MGRVLVQLRPGGPWGVVANLVIYRYVEGYPRSTLAAQAVCRQLGFNASDARFLWPDDEEASTYGGASLPMLLGEVLCPVGAPNLSACQLEGIPRSFLDTEEHFFVDCRRPTV